MVLESKDHLGYGTDLINLAATFRPKLPDINYGELIDTLKRLRPKYLTLCKYAQGQSRCLEYPTEIADDQNFFHQGGGFRLRRTPGTAPCAEELAAIIEQQAPKPTELTPMSFLPLKSFFPTADELLNAELPRLGEVLLFHLKSYAGVSGNSVYQNGLISQTNFQGLLQQPVGYGRLRQEPEYGDQQPQATKAVMEAWDWLQREGILIRDASQPSPWFSISRKGDELLTKLGRYECWEKLGLDQVKADLEHTGGLRNVGGPEVAQMAWDWVRMKQGQATLPAVEKASKEAFQLLEEIHGLLNQPPQSPLDAAVPVWWGRAKTLIEQWDPTKVPESNRAADLYFSNLESVRKGASDRRSGQQQMITLLNQAKHQLELKTSSMNTALKPSAPANASRKVFVVHGHDEGAREKIARFLERIEFEPIILHEQANLGRTVIEKVEAHRDVGFAVVLLTPDDEGCKKGGNLRPRARQNVVLELGYFLGYLGRDHVCPLKRGDLEIPSDFDGVVYIPFDETEGWKRSLGKELEGIGFKIDWNKAMGAH